MPSDVAGRISRTEVLDRAQHWVNKGFEYGTVFRNGVVTSTQVKRDSSGKKYRTDCSGLVAMAWHLPRSLTTYDFLDWSGAFRLPSIHDLKSGDALLKRGHIELFVRWVNPRKHEKGAFVYSFNSTGETVRNPKTRTNFGHLGLNLMAEMKTYRPIRYKKIADPAAKVRAHADGDLIREPNLAICIVVGGAPFHLFLAEFNALGSPPFHPVPGGTFAKMPGIIRDGTFVRVGRTIFMVVGSAKYKLKFEEWAALGKPKFVQVPARLVDALDGVPADNTFLRDPKTKAIFHVVGDAKYRVANLEEFKFLGEPRFTDVPAGFIDSIKRTVPEDTMYLRDPDPAAKGAIFLVVGGAKFLLSAAEYAELRKPGFINVGGSFLQTLGAVPRDKTYIRDLDDKAIFEVRGGKKRHLSPDEWDDLGGNATFTNVPDSILDKIPTG